MATFTRKSSTGAGISTASLPDIIFMLLFFFMVTTVLRDTEILVKQTLPDATQLTKLERKSLVSHLYIGAPINVSQYGAEPRVQANDVFINPDGVIQWVNQEKDKLSEVERDQITISMKVDIETKMGVIIDVQEELRTANARKILYNSVQQRPD